MSETTVEDRNLGAEILSDPADRLFSLLSTFSVLRSNGRVLVDQIRGSLNEMRELRTRLRQQQVSLAPSDGNGDGNALGRFETQYGLTLREAEVAQRLAEGCSNNEIAEQLHISPHTARHHTQRILSKLGVHSRAAAGAKLR
jgi:DNA-binding NarL/FixJ family response regulator